MTINAIAPNGKLNQNFHQFHIQIFARNCHHQRSFLSNVLFNRMSPTNPQTYPHSQHFQSDLENKNEFQDIFKRSIGQLTP